MIDGNIIVLGLGQTIFADQIGITPYVKVLVQLKERDRFRDHFLRHAPVQDGVKGSHLLLGFLVNLRFFFLEFIDDRLMAFDRLRKAH